MDSNKKEVAIFIANYKSFPLTADCIDNIKNVTGLNYKLYVYDLDPETDIDEVEYFHSLWVSGEHSYVSFESQNLTQAFFDFLKTSTEEYKCIMPINHIVSRGWLEELIFQHKKFNDVGVLSIKSNNTKCEVSSLPCFINDQDKSTSFVWVSSNNFVDGILFFNQRLSQIYQDRLLPNEVVDISKSMSFVAQIMMKNNFYITEQNAIYLNIENEVLFPNVKKSLKEYFNLEQFN
jgi:hypothetical protein